MTYQLTGKQRAFIDAYLGEANFNATRAAEMAGYKGNGVTLAAVGYENLKKPHISEEISKQLEARAMSASEVIARLADHARADYTQYIDDDGEVDLAELLANKKQHLIKGVSPMKYGNRIEFYDSQTALITLAKHHGLLVNKVEQQSTNLEIDLNSLTNEQLKRLAGGENIVDILAD